MATTTTQAVTVTIQDLDGNVVPGCNRLPFTWEAPANSLVGQAVASLRHGAHNVTQVTIRSHQFQFVYSRA